MSLIVALLLGAAPSRAATPDLSPALGKIASRCRVPRAAKKHVWIFQQWHLAPSVDTRREPEKAHPQAENQTAIYRQLDRWIAEGKLRTVLAEGCSPGEIRPGFAPAFNGWTLAELRERASDPGFAAIVSHVPLKLEARHGDRVKTVCADDEDLIRKQNLAFSDARGVIGFHSRIEQHQGDAERVRPYLDGVIDLYKLPQDTRPAAALKRLRAELRKAVGAIRAGLDRRNERMAEVVRRAGAGELALVVGAVHAPGLRKLLERAGVGCTIVEPVGLRDDAGKLLQELEAAVAGMAN